MKCESRDRWTVPTTTMPAAVPSKEEIATSVAGGPNVWIAAGEGNMERVKFLLEHGGTAPTNTGVTPTSGDAAKYTPIHAAASYAHHDLLYVALLTRRYLLTYPGVAKDAVDVEDADGDTPLFFCEDIPTATLLLEEFHADANHKNADGLTVGFDANPGRAEGSV